MRPLVHIRCSSHIHLPSARVVGTSNSFGRLHLVEKLFHRLQNARHTEPIQHFYLATSCSPRRHLLQHTRHSSKASWTVNGMLCRQERQGRDVEIGGRHSSPASCMTPYSGQEKYYAWISNAKSSLLFISYPHAHSLPLNLMSSGYNYEQVIIRMPHSTLAHGNGETGLNE